LTSCPVYKRDGVICDDEFGQQDADVICRQAGYPYGALKAIPGSAFGSGNGNILMDNLRCLGNETSIAECPFKGWGDHDCSPLSVSIHLLICI
jgi:hypothetical protein